MAKYLIDGETLTGIADGVRNISGRTDSMVPDTMIETLNTESENFNTNLTNQSDIIAQIRTALEGKSNPSGGIFETVACTIKANGPLGIEGEFLYVDENGNLQTTQEKGTVYVVKNSIVVAGSAGNGSTSRGDATLIYSYSGVVSVYYVTGDCTISC